MLFCFFCVFTIHGLVRGIVLVNLEGFLKNGKFSYFDKREMASY